MTTRKFTFPLFVRTGAAALLTDALLDPIFTTATGDRLDAAMDTFFGNFASRFDGKLAALGAGESSQKSKAGQAGSLTWSQNTDLAELERLVAVARRSARLTFPGDHIKLRSQFQVGIDEPHTLSAEVKSDGIILTSCQDPDDATASKARGWQSKNTTALSAAITQVSLSILAKGDAPGKRVGLTGDKVVAAYADSLRIQNARAWNIRLTKPALKPPAKGFLLDKFPPRDHSEPSGGTQTPTNLTAPLKPMP